MKMFWKRLRVMACLIVMAFLMAGPALAVDSLYVSPAITIGQPSGVPTVKIPITNSSGYIIATTGTSSSNQFVSGKTVTAIVNASRVFNPILSSSGATVTTFIMASTLSAAADSMNFSLSVGPSADGPWTAVYAMGNANFVATGTVPNVSTTYTAAIATATLLPMPYWKIVAKAKKTFSAAHSIYLTFPYPRAAG